MPSLMDIRKLGRPKIRLKSTSARATHECSPPAAWTFWPDLTKYFIPAKGTKRTGNQSLTFFSHYKDGRMNASMSRTLILLLVSFQHLFLPTCLLHNVWADNPLLRSCRAIMAILIIPFLLDRFLPILLISNSYRFELLHRFPFLKS